MIIYPSQYLIPIQTLKLILSSSSSGFSGELHESKYILYNVFGIVDSIYKLGGTGCIQFGSVDCLFKIQFL